ncbi:MAG: 50S ribosomal protein L24 [bacterium]|nr:50S ribosomal protein L24 [bacterium]
MKLRVGDEVLITAGKDKGRRGKIDKVFPGTAKVRVEGLNIYKKNRKGIGDQKGGIIEFARPLPVANVALICPNCGKPTRVTYKVTKTGEKSRSCAKCKRIIESKKEGKQ